jgi:hypothetical protein
MTSKLQAEMTVLNHVPRLIVRADPPRAAMFQQVDGCVSDAPLIRPAEFRNQNSETRTTDSLHRRQIVEQIDVIALKIYMSHHPYPSCGSPNEVSMAGPRFPRKVSEPWEDAHARFSPQISSTRSFGALPSGPGILVRCYDRSPARN